LGEKCARTGIEGEDTTTPPQGWGKPHPYNTRMSLIGLWIWLSIPAGFSGLKLGSRRV
jgi:hypothetical protein